MAYDYNTQTDFWTRALTGDFRLPLYTPSELALRACEYFDWCRDNPLWELDLRTADGTVVETPVEKMRAFTRPGLLTWLKLSKKTWREYADNPDFAAIVECIENILFTQKFEGAAAGLLNANLVARDLGLAESAKLDHTSSDGSMTPVYVTLDPALLSDAAIEQVLNAAVKSDDSGLSES